MNRAIYFCVLMLLIVSCTTQTNENLVKVSGKILSGNVKEVKFEWVRENPIRNMGELYVAEVDSNSEFSIEIPIRRLASARLTTGRFYHEISLLPGDDFFIEVEADTVNYKGKGAEKNNFLYAAEKEGLTDRGFYAESNKGKMDLSAFVTAMQEFKQKRLEFLETWENKEKLEKEFADYYQIETQVIYENLIRNYPRRYAYRAKVNPDSLDLPDEYKRLNQYSSFVDDRKVVSNTYIHNLRNSIYTKARLAVKVDTSLNFKDAILTVLIDSLQGKTREYVLAKWICTEFSWNKYDTLAFNRFQEIAQDRLPIETVEAAHNKYNAKQALLGNPLHMEFAQTLLADTSNIQLSFQEMMNKYKGNVVYLDIWGLGCGPCRAAMPYSKKLKEKLADVPVEFVYLTTDSNREKLWENVFKVSLTDKNHYRLENGFNSRFMKFMEINWVPCYMIFGKEGNLVDFDADRPNISKGDAETVLEKTLRQLAQK